jgi:hypothetical protein
MLIRLLRLSLAALLLAAVAGQPRPVSAQGGLIFFITNVDSSQFPNITFQLRAVNINNDVVSTLTSQNLQVYENGQLVPNVTVTPSEDGPINVLFAIDLGRFSRYHIITHEKSRLALTTLVNNNYFRDGVDQFAVMARENVTAEGSKVLVDPSSTGADLVDFANLFTFPRSTGNTRGLELVDEGIQEMLDMVPDPGAETAAIVFLTRYIEDPNITTANSAAATIAQSARDRFINIYSLQFDSSGQFEQPLRTLTGGASGTNTVVTASNVDVAANAIFTLLNAQRTVYTVSYRSTLGLEAASRTITLNSPQPPTTGLVGTYNVSINNPLVTIGQPAAGATLTRQGQGFDENGEPLFDVDSVVVGADITWPEGTAPRDVKTAELRVNGVLEDQISPDPGATHFDFNWDITGFVGAGPEKVDLEVTVIDELGVETVGSSSVSIAASLPPTVAPTVAPTPTSLAGGPLGRYAVPAVGALLCMGAVAVVLVVAVFMLRPRRGPAPAAPARGAGRPAGAGAGPDHTIIVGSPSHQAALATLTVLEGPRGMIGETINLTKPVTVMGRNPELADVVFYPDEPSSLSRVHATIQLDGKYFVVTDSNSTNGTRVNGQLLRPSDPVQLRDGDELVLGDLGKLGVKMRFSMAGGQDQTELKDRTFIVDDYDQQDWDKFKES